MSTRRLEQFTKHEFNNLEEMKQARLRVPEDEVIQPTDNFIDLVNQHFPDFFKQYPSKELTYFCFDIEQKTDGTRFPTYADPVISIAWSVNDEPVQQMFSDGDDDTRLVNTFALALRDANPDFIIGYNHCKYDIEVLMYKFGMYGVPNELWGREDRAPFTFTKRIGPAELTAMSVPGRIIFDVFHYAMTDQTLNGESRGLKNVASIYAKDLGIKKVIKVDTNNTAAIMGTPQLKEYNECDVENTRALFKMYLKNSLAIADFTGAPLNRLVPLSTTYGFTQIIGNLFVKNRLLADSRNNKRYEWAFKNVNATDEETKPYQGALVACFKTGVFKDVVDNDVNSLYPSIMAALSIGPDNTRIIKTLPIGPYKVEVNGDIRTYYFPDTVRNWTWVIEVKGQSFVANKIKELMQLRLEIKKKSKTQKDDSLYMLAYALKVVLNSCYGMAGSEVLPFGELGVAVATTISGRMILQEGIDFTGPEKILLVDTDALKSLRADAKSAKELNDHFAEWVPRVLKGEPIITWDQDPYEAIYIRQMKTYLTLEKGKFKKHGIAFKGTNHPGLFNKIIDTIGYMLLTKEYKEVREAARKCYKLEQYDAKDFVMTTKINMKLEDYSNPNALQPTIARMAEKKGIPVYVGQSIQYVKSTDGYDLVDQDGNKNLDRRYYTEIITDALSRMGLERVRESRIDEMWG
jgi:DNA polymerase elongation subunit (family B)